MKIKEIIDYFEEMTPFALQESYDNSGVIIGNKNSETEKALICLDITEEILEEALDKKCDLIISHHPLIFKGLKRINGNSYVERIILKAIKNDVSILSVHTNLDKTNPGVNSILCDKLDVKNKKILSGEEGSIAKLVTFCPVNHAAEVRDALFAAGAGHIGNYSSCSFNTEGKGSFKALENANPFVGKKNVLHMEEELRIETIFPKAKKAKILNALLKSHPYEEVAFDIYSLENKNINTGFGMYGFLDEEISEIDFLNKVKKQLKCERLRHSDFIGKEIKKIAVCGGSGAFLLKEAISCGADAFITGDMKYHDFFEAEKKILIIDAGHYETEQFTMELIHTDIIKNFPTFALFISEHNTNPIKYL